MKIKSLIQILSLCAYVTTTSLCGMHGEIEVPRPELPTPTGPRDTDPIKNDYLEQQRLLRPQRTITSSSAAPTPKGGLLRNLLNKIKSGTKPSSEPTSTKIPTQILDTEGLTQADREAIQKINEAQENLAAQHALHRSVINLPKTVEEFQKKTIVLEELFKAELKKRHPSLSDADIQILAEKLEGTVKAQIRSFTMENYRSNNPDATEYLKAIRDEMDHLLSDPLKEINDIKAQQAQKAAQEATQKALQEAATKTLEAERQEKENPTPLAITKRNVPFNKKTETSLRMLSDNLATIREDSSLTPDEKRALNKIIEELNTALPQTPAARDWLLRKNKKWSPEQEAQATKAVKAAMEELANFTQKRLQKAEFSQQLDTLLTTLKTNPGIPTDNQKKVASIFTTAKTMGNKLIDKGESPDAALQELKKKLLQDLKIDFTLPSEEPLKANTAIQMIAAEVREALKDKVLTPEVENLRKKYYTLRAKLFEESATGKVPAKEEMEELESMKTELIEKAKTLPTLKEADQASEQATKENLTKVTELNDSLESALKDQNLTWETADPVVQKLHSQFLDLQEKILTADDTDKSAQVRELTTLTSRILIELKKSPIEREIDALQDQFEIPVKKGSAGGDWNTRSPEAKELHNQFLDLKTKILASPDQEHAQDLLELENITRKLLEEELVNPLAHPGKFAIRDVTPEEAATNPKGFGEIKKIETVITYGSKELGLTTEESSLVSSINAFRAEKPLTYAVADGNVQSPDITAWEAANKEITQITEQLDRAIGEIYFGPKKGSISGIAVSGGLRLTRNHSPAQKAEAQKLAIQALQKIEKIKAKYKKTIENRQRKQKGEAPLPEITFREIQSVPTSVEAFKSFSPQVEQELAQFKSTVTQLETEDRSLTPQQINSVNEIITNLNKVLVHQHEFGPFGEFLNGKEIPTEATGHGRLLTLRLQLSGKKGWSKLQEDAISRAIKKAQKELDKVIPPVPKIIVTGPDNNPVLVDGDGNIPQSTSSEA